MAEVSDIFTKAAYRMEQGIYVGLMALWMGALSPIASWSESGEHLQHAIQNQRMIDGKATEKIKAAADKKAKVKGDKDEEARKKAQQDKEAADKQKKQQDEERAKAQQKERDAERTKRQAAEAAKPKPATPTPTPAANRTGAGGAARPAGPTPA